MEAMDEYRQKVVWPVLTISYGSLAVFFFFWIRIDGWYEVSKSFGFYYLPIMIFIFLLGRFRLVTKMIAYLESTSLDFGFNGFGKYEESVTFEPSPVFFDRLQGALSVSHLDVLFADKDSGVLKLKEPFRLSKMANSATIIAQKHNVEISVCSFDGKKRKSTKLLAKDLITLIETLKN